jgi:hypothetical protein
MYHVDSPTEFARGEKIVLWPGRFDAQDRKSEKECIANSARLCGLIRGNDVHPSVLPSAPFLLIGFEGESRLRLHRLSTPHPASSVLSKIEGFATGRGPTTKNLSHAYFIPRFASRVAGALLGVGFQFHQNNETNITLME